MSGEPSHTSSTRRKYLQCAIISIVSLSVLGTAAYVGYGYYIRTHADETLDKAKRFLAANNLRSARGPLEQLLRVEPDQPEALLLLGQIQLSEKKETEAIGTLSRIPRQSRFYEAAHLALIGALLSDAQVERAEEELLQHLKDNPAAGEASEQLRWLYFNQLRTRKVLEHLEERLTQNDGDLTALPELFDSEFHAQNAYEGLRYLEEVNRRQPRQPSVMLALGKCYWHMGQLHKARLLMEQSFALRPNDPGTRLALAEYLIERNNLQKAGAILAIDRGEEDMSADLQSDDRYWSLRARLSEKQGEFEQSLELLEKALALRASELSYLSRKATLLRLLGRKIEAQETARIAAKLERAQRKLQSLMEQGKHRDPSVQDALTLSELCETLQRPSQAAGWREIARRLEHLRQRNPRN